MAYGKSFVKVELADEGYWANVRKRLTLDEEDVVRKAVEGSGDGAEAGRIILSMAILEWNVDGDAGTILPINRENIGQLLSADLIKCLNAMERGPRAAEDQMRFTPPSPNGSPDEVDHPKDSGDSTTNASSGPSLALPVPISGS